MEILKNILNFWWLFSYKHLRFLRRKTAFQGQKVMSCDFSSNIEFEKYFKVKNNVFYNENPVLLMQNMVKLKLSGLSIICKKQDGEAITWQTAGQTRPYRWISGMIQTWDNQHDGFTHIRGTWLITAKMPQSWGAIWLMHIPRFDPELEKGNSTPEIDIAENNHSRIDNVVHYDLTKHFYTKRQKLKCIHKPDDRFHEYGVKILQNGYEFYLDGYLVNRWIGKGKFVDSGEPLYLIINNAARGGRYPDVEETEMIVKQVKVIE